MSPVETASRMADRTNHPIRALSLFMLGFFVVWTFWAVLLVHFPQKLDIDWLRAGVRMLVWVVPTLLFVAAIEGPPILRHLGFLPAYWEMVRGLLVSIPLALILNFATRGFSAPRLIFPTSVDTWLNPILTAPLAEEVPFRGLVFRFLSERKGFWIGLVASSSLFAFAHLPYWWFSGAKSGLDLWVSLLQIAGIGAVACCLFHWRRSLWMPLFYHWANNFISIALVR